MKHLLPIFLIILQTLSSSARAEETPLAPLQPVPGLDIHRYIGHWYEIARYPNRFQRKCAADSMADYALNLDGTIAVTNSCRQFNGEWIRAQGVGRLNGNPGTATLEVRFAPAWLSFIPAVWGDYWVIDLDPEYQLVAVSEPRRKYLWILSRTQNVSHEAYEDLLARLVKKGFDRARLEKTRQQTDNPHL